MMKIDYISTLSVFLLLVGVNVKGKDDYEETNWIPEGNQKFVRAGTKVVTEMGGKTGHHVIVGLGINNAVVKLDPKAESREGWKLEETTYRLCSSGAPFGTDGLPYIEQKNGNFGFGFDPKPDNSNNGASTTLFGQVILKGKHPKLKQEHKDTGVSGKDTSVTITLKYDPIT